MNKTIRYIMYALIITMCLVAIFVGVYEEVLTQKNAIQNEQANTTIENTVNPINEETKDAFKDLFTNEFFADNFDDSSVEKLDPSLPIVVNRVSQKENSVGKYSIDVNIPIININSDVVNQYNQYTLEKFVNKIDKIKRSSDSNTVYNVSFTAYVNNNVLSVAIMALLKEEGNAQQLIVQAYNYDIAADRNVAINDIIKKRGLDTKVVNKKIKEVVEQSANSAKSMADSGYTVYQRDLDSNMYDALNVENFIQGPNGELYLIYAYGNNYYTTELDVVII